MVAAQPRCTVRERVEAVLAGRKPDRLPFLDRLEVWHRHHDRAGTLSPRYRGVSLAEIYAVTGMGQQKFVTPFRLRLRGVEAVARFEGQVVLHEIDPLVESFPSLWDFVAIDSPGETVTELRTPLGTLSVRHEVLPETVAMGADPYLKEHLVKGRADLPAAQYIMEHIEYVPWYQQFQSEELRLAEIGFAVPLLCRIPFQQVLLEYLGEVGTFYALHDDPALVEHLLALIDAQVIEILHALAPLDVPYVEFGDNLHAGMTNPRLFTRFCLEGYQRYAEILHGQGKKMGSHTDGNLRPLLRLLAESGLDVCESFSPYPLTPCTLEEAWTAWSNGPIIWGGIPSPLLEEHTSDADFRAYIDRLLALVGSGPIILGIGDLVLGNNSIDRVAYIAQRVEEYSL